MTLTISKFSDIGNLVEYYNCSEPGKEPTATDGIIDTWPSGYDELPGVAVQYPSGNMVCEYSGSETVGALKAWKSPRGDAHNRNSLHVAHGSRSYPEGMTLISVTQASSNPNAVCSMASGGGNVLAMKTAWDGGLGETVHSATFHSSSVKAGDVVYTLNTPVITVLTQAPSVDSQNATCTLTTQDSIAGRRFHDFGERGPVQDSDELLMGAEKAFTYNFINGLHAIYVVYDQMLTLDEVDQVILLCQYWVDEGEAPADVVNPTSTSFGPVMANDLGATLTWEVWLDSDATENWQALTGSDVLSDYELSDEDVSGNDMSGTGNRLDILSGQVSDSCQIRCRATTSYSLTGIVTPDLLTARLSVQGS